MSGFTVLFMIPAFAALCCLIPYTLFMGAKRVAELWAGE
jgi:hypothetical protein